MKPFATLVIGSSFGLIAACAAQLDEPVNVADVQETTSIEEATDNLAEAYCDYAHRCHAVGEGAKYASREQCVEEHREEIEAELAIDARCDTGVGLGDLQECTNALERDVCRDMTPPFSGRRRPMACDSRNVCFL